MSKKVDACEMFKIAVWCWGVILKDREWRKFLNLGVDIDSLKEPERSKILEELPVILADQRMDGYMKHPYRLTLLQRLAEKIGGKINA